MLVFAVNANEYTKTKIGIYPRDNIAFCFYYCAHVQGSQGFDCRAQQSSQGDCRTHRLQGNGLLKEEARYGHYHFLVFLPINRVKTAASSITHSNAFLPHPRLFRLSIQAIQPSRTRFIILARSYFMQCASLLFYIGDMLSIIDATQPWRC